MRNFMIRNESNRQQGQTMVEIIVAIGVVVLLATGLIAGATITIKSAQFGKSKTLAARYSQEALEKARSLRDSGWESFVLYGSPSGKQWCLDKLGIWTETSVSCPVNIDNFYTRSVIFVWQEPNMKVDVATTWLDGTKIYRVDMGTILTQWQ